MRSELLTLAVKHAYFPALDRLRRTPFAASLAEALRNERRSRDELAALSLEKLRRILRHAQETVPFYRRRFAEAGVRADDVRALTGLANFPILDKADVFENRATMLSEAVRGAVLTGTTSGSTGIAMTFHFDALHHAWVEAVQWRGRGWFGLERGDSSIVLWSRPVDGKTSSRWITGLKYRLRNSAQFDTFQEFDATVVDSILSAFRRWKPKLLYGYGSSLGRLGFEIRARGITLPAASRPLLTEYTADHMYPAERAVVAEVIGAPVASAYGSSECGGVAQQCRAGKLHMAIDHTIAEFIRDDGAPAAPGETASIVLTQLHNRAMPLIRFRVGDLGSYSDEICPCGSPQPVMNLEVGKVADLITTTWKRNVSAHVLDYVNLYLMKEGIRGVRQFLVEQFEQDRFRLSIVKDVVFEDRSANVFVAKMHEYLGDGIQVDVTFVPEIPIQRTGKRRYFIRRHASDDRPHT